MGFPALPLVPWVEEKAWHAVAAGGGGCVFGVVIVLGNSLAFPPELAERVRILSHLASDFGLLQTQISDPGRCG